MYKNRLNYLNQIQMKISEILMFLAMKVCEETKRNWHLLENIRLIHFIDY